MAKPIVFEAEIELLKKTETEEGDWIIEGFAATTDFDLQGDVITESAIEGSVDDLIENTTVLHNHLENEAIGKVLEAKKVKKNDGNFGLWIKVLISKTVPKIWQKIKEGILNKFSIRGRIIKAKKKFIENVGKVVNVIEKMKLVEVSLVALPANPKARALGWQIAKALEKYENEGGKIDMSDEHETAPEIKPFPLPEVLEKEWTDYLEAKSIVDWDITKMVETWNEFCKQQAYPSPTPYPYPYPKVPSVKIKAMVALLESLISDEKDATKKSLLEEIKMLVGKLASEPVDKNPTPTTDKPKNLGGMITYLAELSETEKDEVKKGLLNSSKTLLSEYDAHKVQKTIKEEIAEICLSESFLKGLAEKIKELVKADAPPAPPVKPEGSDTTPPTPPPAPAPNTEDKVEKSLEEMKKFVKERMSDFEKQVSLALKSISGKSQTLKDDGPGKKEASIFKGAFFRTNSE